MALFEAFVSSEADQGLLFLKRVQAITVSVIDTDGTRTQLHSVRATVDDVSEKSAREAYEEGFLEYTSSLKAGTYPTETCSNDVR